MISNFVEYIPRQPSDYYKHFLQILGLTVRKAAMFQVQQ